MLLNYLSPHPFTIAFDCLKRKWAVYFWLCKLHFDIETLFFGWFYCFDTIGLHILLFQQCLGYGFFVIFFIDVTYWHLDKNTFFMLRSEKKIYQKSVNHINSLDTQWKKIKQFGFGSMYTIFLLDGSEIAAECDATATSIANGCNKVAIFIGTAHTITFSSFYPRISRWILA